MQKRNPKTNLDMTKQLFITIMMVFFGLSAFGQPYPYQNPSLSAQERAKDLCGRLTLEEKAQLMFDESPAIPRLGIRNSTVCRCGRPM